MLNHVKFFAFFVFSLFALLLSFNASFPLFWIMSHVSVLCFNPIPFNGFPDAILSYHPIPSMVFVSYHLVPKRFVSVSFSLFQDRWFKFVLVYVCCHFFSFFGLTSNLTVGVQLDINCQVLIIFAPRTKNKN